MRFKDTIGISQVFTSLAHVLKNTLDRELVSLGITSAQYEALSVLEYKGCLTNADLARSCSVTPQTMNRLITGLLASGLVVKRLDSKNSSKVKLNLSDKALKLLCEAHGVVNKIEMTMSKNISKKQTQELMKLMHDMQIKLKKED